MIKRGVIGFKCFLIHSGVDEFPCVSEEEVSRALAKINGTDAVLAVSAKMIKASSLNSSKSASIIFK